MTTIITTTSLTISLIVIMTTYPIHITRPTTSLAEEFSRLVVVGTPCPEDVPVVDLDLAIRKTSTSSFFFSSKEQR